MNAAPTLVTGATGFVGAAVARALAGRGHRLRLLRRAGSPTANLAGLDAELVEGDLTDPPSLVRAVAGCRFVVHVAADYRLWVPDPATMRRTNLDGTLALLSAAHAAGVERALYCSSVATLGLTDDGTPSDETTPATRIVGHYKQSKHAAEQAVLRMIAETGFDCVIVNPSTPVGPRDIRPTPTGRMIRDAARGRMPAYVDTGLNIVHVDDVAAGHVLALERGRRAERYILGGTDLDMAALLALVGEVCGRPTRPLRLPVAALYPLAMGAELAARAFGIEPIVTRDHLRMARKKMFFSSAKAIRELGYSHRPAREAIVDAIAWFRATGQIA